MDTRDVLSIAELFARISVVCVMTSWKMAWERDEYWFMFVAWTHHHTGTSPTACQPLRQTWDDDNNAPCDVPPLSGTGYPRPATGLRLQSCPPRGVTILPRTAPSTSSKHARHTLTDNRHDNDSQTPHPPPFPPARPIIRNTLTQARSLVPWDVL